MGKSQAQAMVSASVTSPAGVGGLAGTAAAVFLAHGLLLTQWQKKTCQMELYLSLFRGKGGDRG